MEDIHSYNPRASSLLFILQVATCLQSNLTPREQIPLHLPWWNFYFSITITKLVPSFRVSQVKGKYNTNLSSHILDKGKHRVVPTFTSFVSNYIFTNVVFRMSIFKEKDFTFFSIKKVSNFVSIIYTVSKKEGLNLLSSNRIILGDSEICSKNTTSIFDKLRSLNLKVKSFHITIN